MARLSDARWWRRRPACWRCGDDDEGRCNQVAVAREGRGGDGSAGPARAGETVRGGACREEHGRHGSARELGGKGEVLLEK